MWRITTTSEKEKKNPWCLYISLYSDTTSNIGFIDQIKSHKRLYKKTKRHLHRPGKDLVFYIDKKARPDIFFLLRVFQITKFSYGRCWRGEMKKKWTKKDNDVKRDGDFVNGDNTNEQDKPCMIGSWHFFIVFLLLIRHGPLYVAC